MGAAELWTGCPCCLPSKILGTAAAHPEPVLGILADSTNPKPGQFYCLTPGRSFCSIYCRTGQIHKLLLPPDHQPVARKITSISNVLDKTFSIAPTALLLLDVFIAVYSVNTVEKLYIVKVYAVHIVYLVHDFASCTFLTLYFLLHRPKTTSKHPIGL